MKILSDVIAGTTKVMTWVSSGAEPTKLSVSFITGSETIISSYSMVSSGNGHYYAAVPSPDVNGFYVANFEAVIDGKTFVNKIVFRNIFGEID